MKISIERAALLKAVSQAQSVVERRNTIPILANVLIEAEGADVMFRATDLDIEVVDKAPAQVERAGATTVSATTLHEIVRKLPDGALVTLTADAAAGRLTVEAGRSNFSLATLPKEDFPVMASSEYASNFSIDAVKLRRLFDKSKFAISTEETRYYLNGVYMHVATGEDGKVLRCVATDGHRLARIDTDLPAGADEMPGVIVPRKTVGELRKLLDDDEMKIAVSVSETKVRFATPDITLTSKVIDGTFPDYTRVIPQGNTRKLEVDASDFARAVDRVATVSSERSRAVKLQLDEDRLILSVNAPDSGAAEEELAVSYNDERLEIGFNAKYLLEIASQVDRENAVFMFNSSGDPTLMREGNDMSAVYVVMPMRV
ncbi:DNA polymerase III subunit beta [Sulfitobacter pseudonitzschiae]|uniref:Beta sliding clamp n=1 Tax=Pseudosulfitobacter pseudonitzschiae TaxID=1402135 RepID=A0A9Q2NY47_9RHOB|nr:MULTISPECIES: DNA polymerase III subunit beta [Roseobacteraceae]MBM2290571.1 DNA polymerase III subunit beta [Pseudosulfitobacter pseudonitzschiae]MBM2295489.1 DNA polymerase III subunit beta [Pseudosulfitobacter pseudonitzschiae]MBM2300401.1 DNA polymerase III subunit beta [Pseudosulfitobacter pseudonitzschiae]MBM2310186.1 DNA polymerase III subunit beta [Pseudosulfitobacter pseudonitzschiae]MBM2315098.1 DNA polymerase III subunit beta [Pseudosulfitobacter pseudonitzschiae]|tara:strand:- start:345731 stop:346849 length:1119 start_codon:yes stop_codon:yes gene_type:complete